MRERRLITVLVPARLPLRSRLWSRENLGQVRNWREVVGPTRDLLILTLDQREGQLPMLYKYLQVIRRLHRSD